MKRRSSRTHTGCVGCRRCICSAAIRRDIITRAQRIEGVTPALVQDAFRKYFPLDRYTVITLQPEAASRQ